MPALSGSSSARHVEAEPVEQCRQRRGERRTDRHEHERGPAVVRERHDSLPDESRAPRRRAVGRRADVDRRVARRRVCDRVRSARADCRRPRRRTRRRPRARSAAVRPSSSPAAIPSRPSRSSTEKPAASKLPGSCARTATKRDDRIGFDPAQHEGDRVGRRRRRSTARRRPEAARVPPVAASVSRVSVPAQPRGDWLSRPRSAHLRAPLRCESGSRSIPVRSGSTRSASAANARCDSPCTPRTDTTLYPSASRAAASSSVVLPMPASPRTKTTAPSARRARRNALAESPQLVTAPEDRRGRDVRGHRRSVESSATEPTLRIRISHSTDAPRRRPGARWVAH